jgi:hypothetical protein
MISPYNHVFLCSKTLQLDALLRFIYLTLADSRGLDENASDLSSAEHTTLARRVPDYFDMLRPVIGGPRR